MGKEIKEKISQLNGKKVEAMTDFIFLNSKITADGDCSRKIKRHLLLGKKAMTNLDSILRSRDITLLKKVHLVKGMIFPVVMYRCESWNIKKTACQKLVLLNCGAGEDSWESLGQQRSNQSILREISPEYSLEGLMLKLKLQYFGCLMQRADSLEKTLMVGKIEGKRRGWQRMRWLNNITDSMDMHLSKLWKIVEDRGANVLQSVGCKESDTI